MDKNILRKEILERRNYLELDNKSKYDKVINSLKENKK